MAFEPEGNDYDFNQEIVSNNQERSTKTVYRYGGSDPSLDFRARQDEYLMKIRDEGYSMSRYEKDSLLSTYNKDMYAAINQLYQEPTKSKTNVDTKSVQEFLLATNYYQGSIDGLYGKKTIAAMKKYLFDHGGKQLFNVMKDKTDNIFGQ